MVSYPEHAAVLDGLTTWNRTPDGRSCRTVAQGEHVTVFDRFGFIDAIDVAVLAVLLYQAYVLLVGSRAWNVLRGLVALGLLWLVASSIGLEGTKWVFDRVAPVGILALVVVFQPELRAALERVGRGRSKRSVRGDPVKEIMAAVRNLTARRVGALIVIERSTPLGEYGQHGLELDTPVRAELIETLFDSGGPLHDGAVIVRGNDVVYAGAILPLSQSQGALTANLGTRHRAGLGLAELSDALIVILSEERGTVSLARDGTITTDVAPSDVVKALRDTYGEAKA